MQFKIEQVALAPAFTNRALRLMEKIGLGEFVADTVVAEGHVFGNNAENTAILRFNYEADRNFIGNTPKPAGATMPLELELLSYVSGQNWVDTIRTNLDAPEMSMVSHFGMHVTEEELEKFHAIFVSEGIEIAQEVHTKSHTNPHIANSRRYHYRIYATRHILGVDLKFIVRKPIE